jgi:hypothetical protein
MPQPLHLSQAHLHKEKHPDLAPAFGLSEGAVSGQVTALDSERVVTHAQDSDSNGKDQNIFKVQAQESCRGRDQRNRISVQLLEIWAQTTLQNPSPK